MDFSKLICCFKNAFFKNSFSCFLFNSGFWVAKVKKSFRGQSCVPPGGTNKKWIFFFGSVQFDFYIERYICALAFGRIAHIRIPFLSYRSDSQIRIGYILALSKMDLFQKKLLWKMKFRSIIVHIGLYERMHTSVEGACNDNS